MANCFFCGRKIKDRDSQVCRAQVCRATFKTYSNSKKEVK